MTYCSHCNANYAFGPKQLCIQCLDLDYEIRSRQLEQSIRRALRPSTLTDDDERPCTHEPEKEEERPA